MKQKKGRCFFLYKQEYQRWLATPLDDSDLLPELLSVQGNEEEIADRFAIDLSFGTAGLRGVLGAGTNRMNVYTVGRATQGLADYINEKEGAHAVAISFDSRHKSQLFARRAAEVLAANGIKAYLYAALMPTPALSFAVRFLECDAGIMVTASHNPAKYNGYKAYGPDGCQMTTEAADAVLAHITSCDLFCDVKRRPLEECMEEGLAEYMPDCLIEAYYDAVKAQSVRPGVCERAALKVVYTPLNGTGNLPVRRLLADQGVKDIQIVKEQELPDGDFPTCPYPNPEIRQTLELGLQLCEREDADLLLATDPDADRVGIAVKDKEGYRLLTGNETGVLLVDYLARAKTESGTLQKGAVLVKSIVTTGLAQAVAADYGIRTVNVLTGFKYIGEQILRMEEKGEENRFFFGFEESYGYLAGTYVRDKDALVACMLICEMASFYKLCGSSAVEQLEAIYRKYGRYLHKGDSFTFEGLSGMDKMASLMEKLRKAPPKEIAGYPVNRISDYKARLTTDLRTGESAKIDLPKADVLAYALFGEAEVIVRPSGTEPKLKVYYTTRGKDLAGAEEQQKQLAEAIQVLLGI